MTVPVYDKQHPFLASIKERYWLSNPGSQRQTYHVVLDLKGSGLQYHVGDSIAIYPINVPSVVDRTIEAMKADPNTTVTDKQGVALYSLHEYISRKANIGDISRKLVTEIAHRQPVPGKKEYLEGLLQENNREAFKAYVEVHQLWDLLVANKEVTFTPQEVINLLMPLLPRFYSIASSQKVVGDEVHLTVSRLHYISNEQERFGVCTYYICSLAPMGIPDIPIYIQPHHGFTLPSDPSVDIIMVGPGTGVAPFRAFMQERVAVLGTGRNWLFFGEWRHDFDYFYQDYWENLEAEGHLKINTAFSRDQEHKIYVQNRMWDERESLYQWLENGAILYVCGDAHRMAKDVDAMLHRIIETCGNKSEREAKDYMKALRSSKRYLRDVY
ncbi:MAG: sulfite reductase [Parachlamydiaceae bacterium]|nr:sulfite reductase [Parachlamydiaceae bacterium]